MHQRRVRRSRSWQRSRRMSCKAASTPRQRHRLADEVHRRRRLDRVRAQQDRRRREAPQTTDAILTQRVNDDDYSRIASSATAAAALRDKMEEQTRRRRTNWQQRHNADKEYSAQRRRCFQTRFFCCCIYVACSVSVAERADFPRLAARRRRARRAPGNQYWTTTSGCERLAAGSRGAHGPLVSATSTYLLYAPVGRWDCRGVLVHDLTRWHIAGDATAPFKMQRRGSFVTCTTAQLLKSVYTSAESTVFALLLCILFFKLFLSFFAHADGSRVSIANNRVCDSVTLCLCVCLCVCVCVSVRTIKPKRLKLKSPNVAQG